MFLHGMSPEEFKRQYGYLPGGAYQGGIIDRMANGVDGDHIITQTEDERATYHTRYYRQQL